MIAVTLRKILKPNFVLLPCVVSMCVRKRNGSSSLYPKTYCTQNRFEVPILPWQTRRRSKLILFDCLTFGTVTWRNIVSRLSLMRMMHLRLHSFHWFQKFTEWRIDERTKRYSQKCSSVKWVFLYYILLLYCILFNRKFASKILLVFHCNELFAFGLSIERYFYFVILVWFSSER